MNKRNLLGYQLVLLIGLLLSSCNDQLDINTSGESVPVIYALINPSDSVHYVRLTRSFSGEQSANVLARDSSLLYYDQAKVYLEIVSDQGWPVRYSPFTPMAGPARENGTFLESPNRLYQLKDSFQKYLMDNYTVRLITEIPGEQKYCSASILYYTPPEILLPTPSRKTLMNLYYEEPIQIKWEDKLGYTYYQVMIRLRYTNFINGTQGRTDSIATSTSISFYYNGKESKSGDEALYLFHIINGDTFLRLLAVNIPHTENLNYRKFNSFDIVILSATPSYREYLESFDIATDHSGLPVSNISGGTGLFALITTTEHDGYLLDKPSLDSLCYGRYTRNLQFVRY